MASMKEKAQFVLWYHETKSPASVQRKFRNEYGPVTENLFVHLEHNNRYKREGLPDNTVQQFRV